MSEPVATPKYVCVFFLQANQRCFFYIYAVVSFLDRKSDTKRDVFPYCFTVFLIDDQGLTGDFIGHGDDSSPVSD